MRRVYGYLIVVLFLVSACASGGTSRPSTATATVTGTATSTPASGITATAPQPEATSVTLPTLPTVTPVLPTVAPDRIPDLTITILYDNTAYEPRLRADWGFAALIEYGDHTLLFDTGGDGPTLMENVRELGVDLRAVEAILLSHIHGDHTYGLPSVLDTGITPTVYVPASFPTSFKEDVRAKTTLVEVTDPVEIMPGLHTTGEMGASIIEQALVIETESGSVVVTGCAHPGILHIVRQAKGMVDDDVALVVGGFHLVEASSDRVERIAAELRELGVQQVCPTHCTGDDAIGTFAIEYGDDYVQGGVGRVITVGAADGADVPGLTDDELATLSSLEQVDDYPLYRMHYYGDYETSVSWIEGGGGWARVNGASSWACSLFAALVDAENLLYGRNFDWYYSPAVLLYTDPPDGYASISMVDIAYLVDSDQASSLTDLPLVERQPLLSAPLWPFDGMNEHGLVVGMAAVPPGDMRPDPTRETIGSLSLIREMLDHAADVDEAVAMLSRYNVDMEGGPPLHYLLADRSGQAVLVEFYRGEMVVIPRPDEAAWHLATNFLRASVEGDAAGECWRYDALQQRLAAAEGGLTAPEAVELLGEVAQDNTQWSVVYGISAGDVRVVMGRTYEDVHVFSAVP